MQHAVDFKGEAATPTEQIRANAYLPILIYIAMHGRKLEYGQLVAHAKLQNPNIDAVQNAIALSVGKTLSVIRDFTNSESLPDLSSLVISKATRECAQSINSLFDPVEERKRVYAADWNLIISKFKLNIVALNELVVANPVSRRPIRLPTLRGITEAEAKAMMWDYYQKNKETLDPKIKTKANFIVSLIIKGVSVEEAFKQALESIGN
jgi:hypothetical protein